MAKRDMWFDDLMRQYADREDRIIQEEALWRDRVPEGLDKTVRDLSAGILPAVPILVYPGAAPKQAAGKRALRSAARPAAAGKLLAVTAAAAVLLSAGAYTASPALRESVRGLFGGSSSRTEHVKGRAPGEYAIPSPGGDFTVTDEAKSDRLAAKWFTSKRQQVLVQIAYKLPEEQIDSDNIEYVQVGGLWGTVYEANEIELLILRDGDVFLQIQYFNADREELMAYAELLVSQNSGTNQ